LSMAVVREDLEGIRRELEQLETLLPGRPELIAGNALYHVLAGDRPKARELVRSIEGLPEAVRPDSGIANVYARLGDLDAVFRWLDIAVASKKVPIQFLRYEPTMAPVRADPRYPLLLRKMHLE
jgi:hypothetical protein